MYGQIFQSLLFTNACGTKPVCTNGFTAYVTTNQVFYGGAIHDAINVLFLRQTNPAISTDVRFGAFGGPGVDKMIQWRSLITNRVNGAVTTNSLFLTDSFGDWFLPPFLVQTPAPNFYYTFFAAARFRPINYSITHAAPFGYDTLPTLPPTLVDPLTFAGTNRSPFVNECRMGGDDHGRGLPSRPDHFRRDVDERARPDRNHRLRPQIVPGDGAGPHGWRELPAVELDEPFCGLHECGDHFAGERCLPEQHQRDDGDQQPDDSVRPADGRGDPGLERAFYERDRGGARNRCTR